MGVIFRVQLYSQTADATLKDLIGDTNVHQITVVEQWPAARQTDIPEHVPENIASVVQQASICVQSGAFDAAGVMFRKALEISTKEQAPEYEKKTLDKRIEYLASQGRLPSEVRDWAHEIRLEGNFAAHASIPLARDQAIVLQQFCEAYLMYTYTMPTLVAQSRARRVDPLPRETGP